MKNLQPKITVIIPTRERADTLFHCLKTVLSQDYGNMKVIVSDNFSKDNTREIVSSFSDARVKYINTGKRISMSHNWEFALGHVSDGFVTFIGDDDGILPGGIARIAEIIEESGTKAVTSRWGFYYWPGSTDSENQLTIPLSTGYETRRSGKWLAKLMAGEASYQELPYVYTGGFADVAVLNAARNGAGDFFCSMIPDVYSAIALASTVERYVMVNEPVAVMGVSSHSGGASDFGIGKSSEPSRKFHSEDNIPFHPKLGSGRVKSMRIIILESYLQSTHLHRDALKIDIPLQLAFALAQSRHMEPGIMYDYCKEVAELNNLDIEALGSFRTRMRVTKMLVWMTLKTILSNSRCVTVDANRYSVTDVNGASLLSRHLQRYHTEDMHRKSHRLFSETVKMAESILSGRVKSRQPAAGRQE